MFLIDTSTAVAVEPAPGAAGTPGWFTDGNPVTNQAATVVSADWLNMVQGELLAVITAGGLTPSKTAGNQVLQAIDLLIEARTGNYAVDTGAANAYVIALSPPIAAYTENVSFTFRALHANTGASQINLGPGFVPLDRDDGSPLQPGDITTNSVVSVIYDFALNKAMVTGIVRSELGALAKLNIGESLTNDGNGNLEVKPADGSLGLSATGLRAKMPVLPLAGTVHVSSANNFGNFVGAGALDLPQSTTLWNGFCFGVAAKGGYVTVNPFASDAFNEGAAGSALTLNDTQTAFFVTDGAGNWWVLYMTPPVSANGSPYNAAYQFGFVL